MSWKKEIKKRETYSDDKKFDLIDIAERYGYLEGADTAEQMKIFKKPDHLFDVWVDDMIDLYAHWYNEARRTRNPTEEQTRLFGWTKEQNEETIRDMTQAFAELKRLVPSKLR